MLTLGAELDAAGEFGSLVKQAFELEISARDVIDAVSVTLPSGEVLE